MKKSNKTFSQDALQIMKNMNDFQKKLSFGQIYKINRMLVTFFQESQKILCQKHPEAFEDIKQNPVTSICIEIYLAYVTNDYKKWENIEKISEKHAKELIKHSPLYNFKDIKESEEEMKNLIHGAFLIFMANSDKKGDFAENYVKNFTEYVLKQIATMMELYIKETRGVKEK